MLFGLVVTASVQLVGVYVVFASLILPALAVNTMNSRKTAAAMISGALAVLIGITDCSVARPLRRAPVMVFSFATIALLYRLGYRTSEKLSQAEYSV